jgi:hypothetical protein
MKFLSDCSGPCKECTSHYNNCCIAGHGDDHFHQITEKIAKKLLQKDLPEFLRQELLQKFNLTLNNN